MKTTYNIPLDSGNKEKDFFYMKRKQSIIPEESP